MRLALAVDLQPSRFNCQECQYGHHCDEDRALPGSMGKSAVPLHTLSGPGRAVHHVYTCPLPLTSGSWWGVLRQMFVSYDGGHLLNPGGLGAQPAWYVQAMRALASERRDHEKWMAANADGDA